MSDTANAVIDDGQIDHKPVVDAPAVETPAVKENEADPAKPTTPSDFNRVVQNLAFEARQAKRDAATYKAELERITPKPEPGAPPSATEMERMINERAEALIESREGDARMQKWNTAGGAEYSDWTERCNQLADMGAGENKAFIHAITAIPGGHHIVAELSENPAEMVRMLRLPMLNMVVELSSMAQRLTGATTKAAPASAPMSKAPPPITPLTVTARAEVNPDNMSESEFQAYWNKKSRR